MLCIYHGFLGLNYTVIRNYTASPRTLPWKDAATYCSKRNATLLDFSDSEDLQYVENLSDPSIWIGLRKNRSNLTGMFGNIGDLFKIRWCEFANISGHLQGNVSCTKDLLSSVCVKTQGKTA